MKILINYANDAFKKQQRKNSETGMSKGKFDQVIEYGPDKLEADFLNKHASFLEKHKRGGGYWLWKPYIILKTLKECSSEGDYVFYCDSGAVFVNSIDYLIQDLETANQDILLTELPLLEYQWTKQECFNELNCFSDKYLYSNQIQATFILMKNTKNAVRFFEKYYELCSDYRLLNDDVNEEINKTLISHRHDQSLLSLLAKKEGISFFKDISQYGKRPWQYIAPGRDYSVKPYPNSTYPQIVSLYRRASWRKVLIKERIKDLLGNTLR